MNISSQFLVALHKNKLELFFCNLLKSGRMANEFPEFYACIGIPGGQHHSEPVFQHLMNSLEVAQFYPDMLKLAVLLHDIGKPVALKKSGNSCSFHNHEIIGATIAYNFCKRIKFPISDCKYVSKLVRWHMFHFDSSPTKYKKCNKCGWQSEKIKLE